MSLESLLDDVDDLLGADDDGDAGIDEALIGDDLLDDDLLDDDDTKVLEVPQQSNGGSNSTHATPPVKLEESPVDLKSSNDAHKTPPPDSPAAPVKSIPTTSHEVEELDYDDDLDESIDSDARIRREDKFASERNEGAKPTTGKNGDVTGGTGNEGGSCSGRGGYYKRGNINRGSYGTNRRGNLPRGDYRNQGYHQGDVRPIMSTNLGMFSGPMPPFSVPPPGYGFPPPAFNPAFPPPPIGVPGAGSGPIAHPALGWDRAVEDFVKKNEVGTMKRRRSRSRTRSRSYSSSSSCSTCSSYSTSSESDYRRSSSPVDARSANRQSRHKRPSPSPAEVQKVAKECAEAVGVDAEYIKQMEAQKKLRDELLRKKAQRFGCVTSGSENASDSSTPAPATSTSANTTLSPVREQRKKSHDRHRSSTRRRTSRDHSGDSGRRHRHRTHHHRKSTHKKHRSRTPSPTASSVAGLVVPSGFVLPQGGVLGISPVIGGVVLPPPVSIQQGGLPMGIIQQPSQNAQQQPRPPVPAQPLPAIRTVSTTAISNKNAFKTIKDERPLGLSEKDVKPRLVVIVSNLGYLPDAARKIKLFAASVGNTKKVWQSSDDTVSIVFEKVADSQIFADRYHNQIISGRPLQIALHKKYFTTTQFNEIVSL